MATYAQTVAPDQRRYYLSLGLFLASLALLLFTVVEMRRAILLPAADYFKVGAPSPILYVTPLHLLVLLIAGLVLWIAYRYMAGLEEGLKGRGVNLQAVTKGLAIALMVLLIVDLFTYRGVPASRTVVAGKMGVGQAISLAALPGWLQPLAEGINYMALVWHATVLGVLIGALFLTAMPRSLKSLLSGKGFKAHVGGAGLAMAHPFCSCCAAPIGASLYRGGAALGATLAFVVSAPLLNPTSLILAAALLPGEFALLRIAGGLVVGVFLTYAVSLAASRWVRPGPLEPRPNRLAEVSSGIVGRYSRLFRFEDFLDKGVADSPTALVSTWLTVAWRLAKVVVPVLFVGGVVTAAIVKVFPMPSGNLWGVIVAAGFGTLLMVPTWTEIPIAAGLVREGLTGPAAALLVTLPAVSVPCLLIVWGAIRNLRAVLLLGLLVFLVGALAGAAFL
ncbi:MAG: permease [Chloroflexi bacterium]|nr:permease [Chloroflexota bacterium]